MHCFDLISVTVDVLYVVIGVLSLLSLAGVVGGIIACHKYVRYYYYTCLLNEKENLPRKSSSSNLPNDPDC